MTKKDKEMLLDELKKLEIFKISREYDGAYYDTNTVSTDDVMYTILNFIEEDTYDDTKVSLNYEAEYKRLLEQLAKSEDEKTNWKRTADLLKNENSAMRNVIRTFEFILGRKLEL